MPNSNSSTTKRAIELLTPSALSSVLCLVTSLVLSVGAILLNRFNASSLDVEYKFYQSQKALNANHLGGTLLQNNLVQDLPLLFFWALVGVLVYLIALDIVKSFSSAIDLRKQLDYVNARRHSLVKSFIVQMVVRLVAIAIWLPYLILFFHHILPYCLRTAIMATSSSHILSVIGDVLLSVLVGTIAIHINLILMRLLFLKPRLFSNLLD